MLKVLSTKLLSVSLIDSARQMHIALTCIDFIRIHDLDFDVEAVNSLTCDALVFTSSNAVKSFFKNENIKPLALKPIYALSGKTKDELIKQNVLPAKVADNAEQLADLIIANGNVRSVLHICGNLKLDTIENRLSAVGVQYRSLIVYETISSSFEMNQTYDAIMFYSPSGVESFVIKNKINKDTLYCCIGSTTAEKLKSINDQADIILPEQPAPEAMLSAIKDFKK